MVFKINFMMSQSKLIASFGCMFKSGFYGVDSNGAWLLVIFALQNKHLRYDNVGFCNVLRWYDTVNRVFVKHEPHLVYRRQTVNCHCPLKGYNKQFFLNHFNQVNVVSRIVLCTVADHVRHFKVVQIYSDHWRTAVIESPCDYKSNRYSA